MLGHLCGLGCAFVLSSDMIMELSWVFIVRTDVEAETPILWPPDAKN